MAISGDIRCFVQAANGDLLAGVADSAKIFKSTDDGVTWNLVQTLGSVAADTVRAFAKFHPFNALYAAVTSASANRGIWRSTDNGDTWSQVRSLPTAGSSVLQPGASGVDTSIISGGPDFNYGSRGEITVGGLGTKGLIKFDISSIPAGATITSATLRLVCHNVDTTTSHNISIRRSLVEWFEGAQNQGIPAGGENASTWNNRNHNGSVAWTGGSGGATGSDYAASATDTEAVAATGIYNWNVAADVQDFVDGAATNHGWWLIPSNSERKYFRSSDWTTASERPQLTVQYTTSPTSAFSDDGYWDLYAINGFMALVAKDEHNSRAIVLEILDGGLTWHTMPNVASSSVLNYSNPPYAVTRSPHWGDTYSFVAKTNLFATQTARFHPLNFGAIANLLPTSSMGAHNSATAGWRDLDQFTWTDENGRVRHYLMSASYRSIATAGTEIWIVDDNIGGSGPADYFAKIATINDTLRAIYPDPADITTPGQYTSYPRERTVWGAGNGKIWVSLNKGYTWQIATDSPVNQMWALIRTSAGTLIAGGDSAEVFRYTGVGGPGGGGGGEEEEEEEEPGGETGGGDTGAFIQNTAVLGREATATGLVAVSNKFALSNVTHIFNYDGSFTTLQFEINPPYTFFDDTPAVGHIVYFGSRTTDPDVPNGPFTSLVFNLTQAAQDISGWVWEYWNGSVWSALSVTDNTNAFAELGENSVHWAAPSDWATTTVNGADGYWVRIRITGVESDPMPPIHSGRFVYTINLPFINIGATRVLGDIPASARIAWRNLADNLDGSVDLSIDRLLVGLRSHERGPNFNAYLNISDAASPFGITASDLSTHGAFIDSILAPTARAYEASHSSGTDLDSWVDMVEIAIDTSITGEFYGIYRGFLRAAVDNPGTATTWKFRIEVAFGSGGGRILSKEAFVNPAETEFVALDLGRITIPQSATFAIGRSIGDKLTLTVQGYCTTQSVAVRLYDLILMPVDEWSGEARLPDQSNSALSNKVEGDDILEFDSIGNPKAHLEIYHRQPSTLIQTIYRQIANGPAILQANARQRYWFLAMRYNYSANAWTANPSIAGAVQAFKQQRYLGLRGDR